MPNARTLISACFIGAAGLAACSDYREVAHTVDAKTYRTQRADETVHRFLREDASMSRFFDGAYGYVVFPEITKGAAGIGAAHGQGGVVYEQGKVIGTAEVTQITLGAQLGGQDYAEIVFFESRSGLEEFKRNQVEFSANASAVAVASGAAATADYSDGVAVFTRPTGGLMFEASIGGQKFRFTPMESATASAADKASGS